MIKNFIKITSIITIAIVILLIYPAMIQSDSSRSSISIKNTNIKQIEHIALKLRNTIKNENKAENNSVTTANAVNNKNSSNKDINDIKNINSNDENNYDDEIINSPAKPDDQEEKSITVTGVVSSFDYSCQMPGTNYDIQTDSKRYYLEYKSAPYSELGNFVGKNVKVTGKVINYNLEGGFSVIVVDSISVL